MQPHLMKMLILYSPTDWLWGAYLGKNKIKLAHTHQQFGTKIFLAEWLVIIKSKNKEITQISINELCIYIMKYTHMHTYVPISINMN